MSVTLHVLDCMHGRPAEGISVLIGNRVDGAWRDMVRGHTDDNGSLNNWYLSSAVPSGVYRIELDIDGYYATLGIVPFHSWVTVAFRVFAPADDQHLTILITPNSYMVYGARGLR